MLVPEKTSGPSCVTSRPSDSVRMIANLRWIRELVPINALVLTEPTSSDRPVESSRRGRLSHLYFRCVAFYCRSLLAPLQTHPCAPARAILPAIPGVAATVDRSNRRLSTIRARRLPIASFGIDRTLSAYRVFSPTPSCAHASTVSYRYFPFPPIALKYRSR
jgi:hypothetical protein